MGKKETETESFLMLYKQRLVESVPESGKKYSEKPICPMDFIILKVFIILLSTNIYNKPFLTDVKCFLCATYVSFEKLFKSFFCKNTTLSEYPSAQALCHHAQII